MKTIGTTNATTYASFPVSYSIGVCIYSNKNNSLYKLNDTLPAVQSSYSSRFHLPVSKLLKILTSRTASFVAVVDPVNAYFISIRQVSLPVIFRIWLLTRQLGVNLKIRHGTNIGNVSN